MKQAIENRFRNNYQEFFLKYLPEAKSLNESEYLCRCPFNDHDDKTPSFNFNVAKGTYICRGCNKQGNIFHFWGKLHGFPDTKKDFPKILRGICKDFGIEIEKRKIVETYDYADPQGNLIYQVVRFNDKTFSQRHRNGNGSWTWGMRGIMQTLYNLPLLSSAKEVIVVEGERDCESMMRAGFITTTNPMGAGKWRDEYNQHLKDKNVVLIPDNDDPGRRHMIQIGQLLLGVASSIKWLDLPDLPSKGDVSDFIEKIGEEKAAEELKRMIQEAPEYQPPKKVTIEDIVVDARRFLEVELPKKEMILEPWLSEQCIVLISGWRGTGKTWFALSLLNAISRGEGFGPWKCKNPVPTLYVDGEMAAQDLRERIFLLNPSLEWQKPLHVYSDSYSNFLGLTKANLLSETWRNKIKGILQARHVKVFVIDNLASLASNIDENSKKDYDPINQWLLDLRFSGITSVVLHHANKNFSQRGTSSREDALDTSIILKSPFDYVPENGCSFICHFSKARVRTKDLNRIADTHFQLCEDENGELIWTHSSVKGQVRGEVLKRLEEGIKQNEIAEQLGITKGRVSQIRAEATKNGHLTPQGKLTQFGHALLNSD